MNVCYQTSSFRIYKNSRKNKITLSNSIKFPLVKFSEARSIFNISKNILKETYLQFFFTARLPKINKF